VWVAPNGASRLSEATVACHHFAASSFRYSRRSYSKRPKWLIPALAFPSQDRTPLLLRNSYGRSILQDRNNARGIALSHQWCHYFRKIPAAPSSLFDTERCFSPFFSFSFFLYPGHVSEESHRRAVPNELIVLATGVRIHYTLTKDQRDRRQD